MSAPQSIHDVLRGPHVNHLIRDDEPAIVIAEPLRFLPVVRIGDRYQVFDRETHHG